jgi:hypothetical protein
VARAKKWPRHGFSEALGIQARRAARVQAYRVMKVLPCNSRCHMRVAEVGRAWKQGKRMIDGEIVNAVAGCTTKRSPPISGRFREAKITLRGYF